MIKIKKSVDNTNCCVYGCHTCRENDKATSFHLFPTQNSGRVNINNAFGGTDSIDRKKAWEQSLLMGKPSSRFMRVCGKHFTKEDYKYASSYTSKRPRLKPTAVPSQNLPKKKVCKKTEQHIISERGQRRRRRLEEKEAVEGAVSCMETDQLCPSQDDQGHALEDLTEDEREAINTLLDFGTLTLNSGEPKIYEDKGVQVKSGDLCSSFTSKIENEKHLNSLTGLSSFLLLNNICSLVDKYYRVPRSRKLSLQDRVVLVFIKLKMAIKFNIIAIFFQIAPSTCREIFNEYVQYIANVLSPCIVWPSMEECRSYIPLCFKQFQNVRGIW